jgi:hypothetical protein
MASELVYRIVATLVVVRRFPGMDIAYTLVHCVIMAVYFSFIDILMFFFDVFGGMCGENSCNVSAHLHGTLDSYLHDARGKC